MGHDQTYTNFRIDSDTPFVMDVAILQQGLGNERALVLEVLLDGEPVPFHVALAEGGVYPVDPRAATAAPVELPFNDGEPVAFSVVVEATEFVSNGWHDVRLLGSTVQVVEDGRKWRLLLMQPWGVFVTGREADVARLSIGGDAVIGLPGDFLDARSAAIVGARDGTTISWWAAGACWNDGEGRGAGEAGVVLFAGGEAIDFQYASVPAQRGNVGWREGNFAHGTFADVPTASRESQYSVVNLGHLATGLGGLTPSFRWIEQHWDIE
jgi:hypothetical protein